MCLCCLQVRIGELVNELQADQLSIVLWSMGKLQAYPGIEVMETLVSRSRISLAEHAPQVRLNQTTSYWLRQGFEYICLTAPTSKLIRPGQYDCSSMHECCG